MSKKGFTLIELLVVIAIIGILASIVLVTFPTAQDRAKDARIINALSQMRTSLVLYYDDYNDYDETAAAGDEFDCTYGDMVALCAEVTENGGTTNIVIEGPGTGAASDEACIYSALNTGGKFFCVDDTGQTFEGVPGVGEVLGADKCVATDYTCP